MSETLSLMRPVALQDLLDGINRQVSTASSSDVLVQEMLRDQQDLTAVALFSREHDHRVVPAQSRYYSKLLPLTAVGPGQQYAFEVDLDRCSGCKACVTACHALNGLDDTETWRDVGLLIGGSESTPVMQHVTAACHHCLEPGCMAACPVNAYEKDALTGIVRHLDDQCFGCQYCTLACPYNVPKYHAGKGIVRKCDMCSNRLSQGEAPACVQACPHEAIAIRVVDIDRVRENAEVDQFLPAAPEPYLTLPTTTYKSKRVFPRNMLPADYYSISPQHPHWPLIIMLVLTQLSVGAFAVGSLLELSLTAEQVGGFRPIHATGAMVLGLLALGASTCHLGRPLYAFRGILGFRHSWLSREIVAFGAFAGLAVPLAGMCWLSALPATVNHAWVKQFAPHVPQLSLAVSVVGLLGVFCSVMIYVFTKRELWSFERTLIRFGLTTVQLGLATTWLMLAVAGLLMPRDVWLPLSGRVTESLATALIITTVLKLVYDISLLVHLTNFRNTPLKRSALLVVGPLRSYSLARLICGTVGGVLVPLSLLSTTSGVVSHSGLVNILTVSLLWSGCVVGELMERYLFFAAVSSSRMPGGVRP